MNLRQYLSIMLFSSALCWVAWLFVVFNIDPFETNLLSFGFFYVSFFLALLGTLSLILFWIYCASNHRHDPMYLLVQKSFRDSIALSAFLVFLLFLQGARLLNLWNFIILVAAAVSLAVFLIFNKKVSRAL